MWRKLVRYYQWNMTPEKLEYMAECYVSLCNKVDASGDYEIPKCKDTDGASLLKLAVAGYAQVLVTQNEELLACHQELNDRWRIEIVDIEELSRMLP